jgi:hypothetical protein
MTARIRSITIALDYDIRDDDVQSLVDAIKMMRYVAAITTHEVVPNDFAAESRINSAVCEKLYKLIYELQRGNLG